MRNETKACWVLLSGALALLAAGCPTYIVVSSDAGVAGTGAAGSGAGGAAGAAGYAGVGGDAVPMHGSCVSCDRVGEAWRAEVGAGGTGDYRLECYVSRGYCEGGCLVQCVQHCDPFYDPGCIVEGGAGGAGGFAGVGGAGGFAGVGGAGGFAGVGGFGGGCDSYAGGVGGGYESYAGGVGGGYACDPSDPACNGAAGGEPLDAGVQAPE